MIKAAGGGNEHLRWVTRILKNPKRFSDYSVKRAREIAEERGIKMPKVAA